MLSRFASDCFQVSGLSLSTCKTPYLSPSIGSYLAAISTTFLLPLGKSEPKNKVLDWEKDSATIWADFRGYFGIDLDKENFHWWEFMALFESLPKDCAIKRIMGIRAIDLSKIKDPEIRAEYEEQKRLVALEAPENDFWDESSRGNFPRLI